MQQSLQSNIAFAVLLGAFAGALGCAGRAPSARPALGTGDWRLLAINGVAAVPGDLARRPTIRFSPDSARVNGSGGCNSYGGSAAIGAGSMVIRQVISTKRACMDASLNDQETRFFHALETVDHYGTSGDTLDLYRGSGVALRFVR